MSVLFSKFKTTLGILLLLTAILFSGACKRRPAGILSDSEMEDLMVDMMLADAYDQSAAGRGLPDSLRSTLGERVLKAHGVDYATLDSTFIWYSSNLDEYQKLYVRVDKRLKKEQAKIEGKKGMASKMVEENDIWQLPRHILFSPLAPNDVLVFELPGESVEKGDRLEWKLWVGNNAETDLLLGVDYTDGSKTVAQRNFNGDRKPEIKLITDTARIIRRVYGVLTVPRVNMPVAADSIRLIRLPYDSIEYGNRWSQKYYHAPVRKKKEIELQKDTIDSDSAKIEKK